MSVIRVESSQQRVWDNGGSTFDDHALNSFYEKGIRVSQNDGLKILTSCAAVVVISLVAGQPTAVSNSRVAPTSIPGPSEQLRPLRSSQRDRADVESYFDVTKVLANSLVFGDKVLEEVREETTMLNTTELNRRERVLKTTINGTAFFMIAGLSVALFGGFSLLELIPGLCAGIGVLGSCGIQLNKVDAHRNR
ncbi:hypothetical protein [Aeromonas sp. MR16]|uniref:hypothetical protein n=1 Tax=Aeromonas sp. MR16 TaxID=2923420 RepID=UPI001F4ADD4D|nr:hypothetical protein [Aeromonas sp. MR16]MCH7371048.1 hypothetical protein [Aeromonas sp. MR16]